MVSALLLAAAVSLGYLIYNPEEKKQPFDYPSYEEAYAWERTSGDEEPMIWCAKSQIATHSIPSYSDNGSTDDKPNGAMTVDSSSGHIEGTLNLNSKSDQVLHGLGERDEDYFCFQTREQLRYDFKISNPSNYHFEICRYQRNKTKFVCDSTRDFSQELEPATYYIHVFASAKEDIVDGSYQIDYTSTRDKNCVPYNSSGTSDPFKLIVWENEMWPFNAPRRGDDSTTLQSYIKTRRTSGSYSGYVDPIFLQNATNDDRNGEEFLESYLYVLGHDKQEELGAFLQNVSDQLAAKLQEEAYEKVQSQIVETATELILKFVGLTPVGQAIDFLMFPITIDRDIHHLADIVRFCFQGNAIAEVELKKDTKTTELLEFCKELQIACSWAVTTNQAFLRIPRFYTVHKIVVRKTKYTTNYKWVVEPSYLSKFNYTEDFKCTDKVIHNVVKHPKTNVEFTGSINLLYGDDALGNYLKNRSISEDERNA